MSSGNGNQLKRRADGEYARKSGVRGYEKQIQPRITPMQTTIERSEIDDIIEVELEAEVRRQRWISSASASQSQPQKRANFDAQMGGGRDLLKKVRLEDYDDYETAPYSVITATRSSNPNSQPQPSSSAPPIPCKLEPIPRSIESDEGSGSDRSQRNKKLESHKAMAEMAKRSLILIKRPGIGGLTNTISKTTSEWLKRSFSLESSAIVETSEPFSIAGGYIGVCLLMDSMQTHATVLSTYYRDPDAYQYYVNDGVLVLVQGTETQRRKKVTGMETMPLNKCESDQPSSSSKYLSPQKGLVDLTECLELLLPPAIHRDRRQSTTGAAGIELEQMSISDVSEEEETCSQITTDSPEYEPPSDMSTE